MTGFTDIHCHILPGLDDGPSQLEDTLKMLEIAYGDGIRKLILTSHFRAGYWEAGKEHYEKAFTKVKELAKERWEDMEFFTGSEIYFSYDTPLQIEQELCRTLAGGSYVLLEFSPLQSFDYLRNAVWTMVENGYRPIIAHIERYRCLMEKNDSVEELIGKGAYIQVNASVFHQKSILLINKFIKRQMREHNVHFIATDAHGWQSRKPILSRASAYIEKKYGKEYCEDLFEKHPKLLLENQYIRT